MKPIIRTLSRASVHFLITIILVGIFTGQTLAQAKVPKITFTETNHDFGKVEKGVELAYEFRFKNEGEDTLVIKNVRASCGCTGATIGDKKEFTNGEEGEIKITFNTSGRSGIQSKTVSVQSNDPGNQTEALSFTCDIISK